MTGVVIGALLFAASLGDNLIYDSFIRDDVKPTDYEKLTESASPVISVLLPTSPR